MLSLHSHSDFTSGCEFFYVIPEWGEYLEIVIAALHSSPHNTKVNEAEKSWTYKALLACQSCGTRTMHLLRVSVLRTINRLDFRCWLCWRVEKTPEKLPKTLRRRKITSVAFFLFLLLRLKSWPTSLRIVKTSKNKKVNNYDEEYFEF